MKFKEGDIVFEVEARAHWATLVGAGNAQIYNRPTVFDFHRFVRLGNEQIRNEWPRV